MLFERLGTVFSATGAGLTDGKMYIVDIQGVKYAFAKGNLLQGKRLPFRLPFAAFCTVKGCLLEISLFVPVECPILSDVMLEKP